MASDIFNEAFSSNCGSIRMTCECGKTYYDCTDKEGWENGEYEALISNPNAIAHNGCVCSIEIDGNNYVMGCGCHYQEETERFILRNGESIAKYLNLHARHLEDRAERIRVEQRKPGMAESCLEEKWRHGPGYVGAYYGQKIDDKMSKEAILGACLAMQEEMERRRNSEREMNDLERFLSPFKG